MLIPEYWAEARIQQRRAGRQVTVRRYGWSDESQAAAQEHAQLRAEQALESIFQGENLPRQEAKNSYGDEDTPIREEIIDRNGSSVVTRNSYGALCLNTPNVLFADIDFNNVYLISGFNWVVLTLSSIMLGSACWAAFGAVWLLVVPAVFVVALLVEAAYQRWRLWSDIENRNARNRIDEFAARHPDWCLRVYRTPAGYRVLVTHDVFAPEGEPARELFEALDSDPVYVLMCRKQSCFRARVSPKPWRIGMKKRIKPRRGAWPFPAEKMPYRRAWVAEYEEASKDYAACEYIGTLGKGATHPDVARVQELHDRLSRALSGLPTA